MFEKLVTFIYQCWQSLLSKTSYVEKLKDELETERMRLAGCGVVAMQNTVDSAKERITQDSPYWSASYGDVCRAVDAEILYRTQLEQANVILQRYEAELTAMVSELGLNMADFKTNGGDLELDKLKEAVIAIAPAR